MNDVEYDRDNHTQPAGIKRLSVSAHPLKGYDWGVVGLIRPIVCQYGPEIYYDRAKELSSVVVCIRNVLAPGSRKNNLPPTRTSIYFPLLHYLYIAVGVPIRGDVVARATYK